jgi:hypothetical protein
MLVSNMQFGSCPGKQCISAVLHKLLCYDTIQHMKKTAAFIKNDAFGHYNQMVNNILILCLQCKASSELLLTEGCKLVQMKFPQIECTDSFQTLGSHLSPCRDTKAAWDTLQVEAISFAKKISSSTLSHQDVYWTGFSFLTMTISHAECTFIQSPALCATLSKLHLNRHIA